MNRMLSLSVALSLLFIGCFHRAGMSDDQLPGQLVQSGSVVMPQAERPTGDPWELVFHQRVRFPRRYGHIPAIRLSVKSIEAYTRREGTYYQLNAADLDSEGFDLQIYGAYMNSFSNCEAEWIAIGHR